MALTDEMASLKSRLKDTWTSGNYGHFATYLEPGALAFLDRLNPRPATTMLDVACGAGQLSIPAARRGISVTGLDLAPNSLAQARERASDEGLSVRFDEGDAEDLPYGDQTFDLVVSLIGAMFAPRPDRVAAELIRVCRSGGRIAMGSWTAGGFVGQMFKTIGKYAPPSPIMPSPLLWGDEATVRDRLSRGVRELRMERRMYPMDYPFPPADVVRLFREEYGPARQAFLRLNESDREALREDLEALWTHANQGGPNTTKLGAEYLEVVAIRA